MSDCLIIFAKEPEKGKVKTRLSGHLSAERCFKLYKAFLKDTLGLVKSLRRINKVLAYDLACARPRYLKRIARNFIFYKQSGNNLGQRMHNAFLFARQMNSSKAVIIGSDSPNLPAKHIKDAFQQLDRNDIVLGPAEDGGYYLIGLKKPCAEIFRSIKWSSETVFAQTVENCQRLNKKIAILHKWYDVDDYIGLVRLKTDLKKEKKAAAWTRKLLKI